MQILTHPHHVLRQVSRNVPFVNSEILTTIHEMFDTMYNAEGCGLAAPQVGILKRIFVMDVGKDYKNGLLAMINPEIIWSSKEMISFTEGCLSVPEKISDVRRHEAIKVRYMNESGATKETKAEGLMSVCIQHEIDHLNGVLFIDYLEQKKTASF